MAKLAELCAAIDDAVMVNPVCKSCPVARKPAGCGYLAAGTPCQHWEHRGEWQRLGGMADDDAMGDDGDTEQEGDDVQG